jgi:hypothetical protein
MKRGLKLFLSLLVLGVLLIAPIRAFAVPELNVSVNGEVLTFKESLILEKGRTLVPLNGVFEKLNAETRYDKEQNKVFIEDKYTTVELTIGDKIALVHKKYDFSGIPLKVTLDVPAKLVNGVPYLPLRFVAESLGAEVTWEGKTRTAAVTTESAITPVETPAEYTVVNPSEIQGNSELVKWYEENYKNKGVYNLKAGKDTYVLLSAGEEPTGGYSLEADSATIVSPGSLYVTAKLTKPAPDAIVTMVVTYPNVLIKFENQTFDIVDGSIHE